MIDKVEVWIAGQYRGQFPEGTAWDFQGVFATEAEAIAACENPSYFVFPATVGERLPDQMQEAPGCYYPLARAPEALPET
jgi:hypothetical protein